MRAEVIALALGGCRIGRGWMARCPAHEDHEPSLSIVDGAGGKVLIFCHAGCDQRDVVAALRSLGLWQQEKVFSPRRETPRSSGAADERRTPTNNNEVALSLWRSARQADNTLVPTYLASRGLYLPPPETLRFHPFLKHPSGGAWPAMLALVTRGDDNSPAGIHRTFLARDGVGKARVDPQKMMLGPCRGGAVRLAPLGDVLLVGEGVETCLAAMQATGLPAWAALSTAGLRSLELPANIRELIILADGDEAGEVAARSAALRWTHEGRRVRIARPPRGLDFNDLLLDGRLDPERVAA